MTAPDDRWVEATVRVAPADIDAVADAMRDAGAEGVAIEPALLISDSADFAYEELGAPALVRATFPLALTRAARRALRRHLDALALSAPLPRLRYAEVGAHLWASEWQRFYHVQHIGKRLVVRPSWEAYTPQPGEVVVELDPGTAFGTGQHETTRLCLAAVERVMAELDAPDVLDVGAGSGILSIAALKLGARSARAIDVDADTPAIARENARLNGVAASIACATGSLEGAWPWHRAPARASADLLLCNISSTVVLALMRACAAALRSGGIAILSGFIARDADEVRDAAIAAGLRPLALDAEGEWRCLVALR
ncbi:MAG: 50S ribosomal protein L11 methyltransferase [Dehalococcoidia bacterium]|nr:50S ribosomal protein L11 methyltransferase [Dehalococcoidia bacterium]